MCMHQNKLWGISKNSHVIMSYIQTPHKLHSTDYIIHLQFFLSKKILYIGEQKTGSNRWFSMIAVIQIPNLKMN